MSHVNTAASKSVGGIARSGGRGKIPFTPLTLMLPAILLVLLVTFAPIIQGINLSFHQTKYLRQGEFIGLDNYIRFFRDADGLHDLLNSAVASLGSLAFALSIGLALALLLNRPFRGRTALRTMLILPWIMSPLLSALLWRFMYSPQIGPIAYILGQLTNSRFDLLGNPNTAMLGIIIAAVWRSYPYPMILILAALQTIPEELYEAGKIDGAGRFQLFRFITVPLIQNTVLIVVIILTIGYFNMVELPFVLTGGGPLDRTEVIGLRVYQEAFMLHNFGFASAIAVVMLLINIGISLIYIRILRNERHA
jgi:multiple sugar transport system permease protein